MKNGVMHIGLFELLDEVRNNHGISNGQWAKASALPDSRVSELRKKARLVSEGKNPKEVGRAFTASKWSALVQGLQILIGVDTLKKELLRLLDKARTQDERIALLSLMLPEDQKDAHEMYLKALLGTGN